MTINMESRRFHFLTVGKLFNNVYLVRSERTFTGYIPTIIPDGIFAEINKLDITVQRLVSKLIQENIEKAFISQL